AEFLEIKKHPGYTLDLLKRISTIPDTVPLICYQVHERPNGTGYPRGRKSSSIHPGARILHVVDVYLALTSARPFRKPLMPYAAIECLLRQAKEHLVDVEVVRALLHVVSLFPIGSHVMLSDGSTARVLRRNGNNYSSPIVQIIQDADGEFTDLLDETQIIDPSAKDLKIVKALPATDREQIALDPRAVQLNRA
ncbi:MAG TPA: HD domain-containing phosphohydrolase, partial [Planctomycetaceae bacterium]